MCSLYPVPQCTVLVVVQLLGTIPNPLALALYVANATLLALDMGLLLTLSCTRVFIILWVSTSSLPTLLPSRPCSTTSDTTSCSTLGLLYFSHLLHLLHLLYLRKSITHLLLLLIASSFSPPSLHFLLFTSSFFPLLLTSSFLPSSPCSSSSPAP